MDDAPPRFSRDVKIAAHQTAVIATLNQSVTFIAPARRISLLLSFFAERK